MLHEFLTNSQELIDQISTCEGDLAEFEALIDRFSWCCRYEFGTSVTFSPSKPHLNLVKLPYKFAKEPGYDSLIQRVSEFSQRMLKNPFCPVNLLFHLEIFRVYWPVICSNEVFALYVQENDPDCDRVLQRWFSEFGYEKHTQEDVESYEKWSILSEVVGMVPSYDARVVQWINENLALFGSSKTIQPLGDGDYHPKTGKVYKRALSSFAKSFIGDYAFSTTRDIVYGTNQLIGDDVRGVTNKRECWNRYFMTLCSLLRDEGIRGKFTLLSRVKALANSLGTPYPVHPLSLLTEDGTYLPISSEMKPFDSMVR